MFKIGDKVKCVDASPIFQYGADPQCSSGDLKFGEIYNVHFVTSDGSISLKKDSFFTWSPARFELYAPLSLNDYQAECLKRAGTRDEQLVYCCLGLAGEAGEVIEHVKKWKGHGRELDKEYLKKELGDVLWYLAVLGHEAGLTLGEIAQANVDKLAKRYPQGFSVAASQNRSE